MNLLQIAQIKMQDDVSMFIFLPDDVTSNMTLLEESLTAEFVQDLSMTLMPAKVSLTLPALRLSYATDLLPLLGDLGESQPAEHLLLPLHDGPLFVEDDVLNLEKVQLLISVLILGRRW